MSEKEQNKKINELDRRLTRVKKNIKTLNIDLEPDGRVSEAFDHLENSMDKQFKYGKIKTAFAMSYPI